MNTANNWLDPLEYIKARNSTFSHSHTAVFFICFYSEKTFFNRSMTYFNRSMTSLIIKRHWNNKEDFAYLIMTSSVLGNFPSENFHFWRFLLIENEYTTEKKWVSPLNSEMILVPPKPQVPKRSVPFCNFFQFVTRFKIGVNFFHGWLTAQRHLLIHWVLG